MSNSVTGSRKRAIGNRPRRSGLADSLTPILRKPLALGLALMVLLAACSTSSGQSDGGFPLSMYTGASVVGGEEISFSDLQGRPIVLNFWAGLCPPCRAEMPDLQEFNDEYHDDVLLIGVDVGQFTGLGNQEDAVNLLNDLGISYPTGSTSDGSIMQTYGVLTMPTTVFISPDGEVFRKWSGVLDRDTLAQITDEMLAGTQG